MLDSILVPALGVLSSITLVISALSLHRFRLISFGIATAVLVAIQYGLVGAWMGLVVLTIGLVRSVITLISLKHPILNHWLFIPFFIAVYIAAFIPLTDWDTVTFYSFIPLLGGIIGTVAIWFKQVMYTKMFLIAGSSLWLIYQFENAVYGQMIGEGLNLIANIVALSTLIWAKYKGIPAETLKDVDTQILDVITSSIPIIHPEHIHNHQGHKPVRGAHGNSVAYARWVEESEPTETRELVSR